MGFAKAIEKGLADYLNFSGRSSRAEFWWFILFQQLIIATARLVDGNVGGWLTAIVMLVLFLPALAVSVRRVHDLNRSAWWAILPWPAMLCGFVLMVASRAVGLTLWGAGAIIATCGLATEIVVFAWNVSAGTPGPNRFGEDPIDASAEQKPRAATTASPRPSVYFAVAAAAIMLVSFRTAFQPFNIPSGSNEPTILVGDYLFTSNVAYGFGPYSFPYIPVRARVLSRAPERGDTVVFKFPADNTTDYIKRLVGLPGDRIQMMNSVLYINDKPVPRVRVQDYIEYFGPQEHHVTQFRETLPNGASYNVLQRDPEGDLNNTQVFVVPAGHYFMIGDNRDNSADSRANVGYVPFENLVGKAEVIFFSTNGDAHFWEFWKWPSATRFDRIGATIH